MNPDLEFVRGLRERCNLKARMLRHQAQVISAPHISAMQTSEASAFQSIATECDTYLVRREAELSNGRRP